MLALRLSDTETLKVEHFWQRPAIVRQKNAELTNLSIFGSGIAVVKQKSAKLRQSLLAALRLLDKKTLDCKHYWQRPCDCLTDTFR